MKKLTLLFFMLIFSACGERAVEKPDNLIEEDKMADILYDLSVLEAMKSQRSAELSKSGIDPATYVYEKHNIDSVQLAASNRYYAADLEKYKEIYDKVREKLDKGKSAFNPPTDKAKSKEAADDTPRVE